VISGKLKRVRVRGLILLVVVCLIGVALLIPPSTLPRVDATWTPSHPVVRGAYHIHSDRSDGSGTVDEIAAEAAGDGLNFIILTDHGDAMRPADPPTYRSGVLCIDGVEVSTSGGHYVGLGLRSAAAYPLGGPPRAVVEDIARLGGFGIVAHPDSAKPELRWGDWDTAFDGLEWLNADSEWRDESYAGLMRILLTYWFRPAATLASALDRPVVTLERWDALTRQRRVPALAGADAHARIGGDRGDPYAERAVVHTPSYGVSFQTFRNSVVLDAPFTGDAATDGARLLAAIGAGRVFTTIDGLLEAGQFEFTARSGGAGIEGDRTEGPRIDGSASVVPDTTAQIGEYLDLHGSATLDARVAAPSGSTIVLMRDGMPIHSTQEPRLHVDVGTVPGAYRVEVRLAGQPAVPWLLTNPIYVGLREAHARIATAVPVRARATVSRALPMSGARGEGDPRSTSTLTLDDPANPASPARWTYALGDGARAGQYAAVQLAAAGLADVDRVVLRVSAERPMRAWLQLRAPSASLPEGERWGTSFYADATEREVSVFFDELRPFGVTASAGPALDRVDSILLVADTVNSRPGMGNTLRIVSAALGRSRDRPAQ
jgi:hypothetical protein